MNEKWASSFGACRRITGGPRRLGPPYNPSASPGIMPLMSDPLRAPGLDPERYAGRLAPVGAVLAVAGGCVGGWVGLGLAAVGFALLLLACFSRDDGLLILGPF